MRLFGRPISFQWILLLLIISGTLFSFSFFTSNYDAGGERDVLLLKFENQRTQAILQEEIDRLKTREADLETFLEQITTKLKAGEELAISDFEEIDGPKNDVERDLGENDDDDNDFDDGKKINIEDFSINVPKSLKLKWAGSPPVERRKIEIAKGVKPKVIIMSLPRSGSSFIGEIFNQNPEFIYLFEPSFPTMGNAIWECQVSDPRMSTIATEVFKCEFSRFFAALARHAKKKHYIYRDYSTSIPILKNYTNGCEDSMVAIKEVRRWGPNLKDLYSVFGSNLKIIWLLRDPRGWVSSFLFKNANHTASTEFVPIEKAPLYPPFQVRGNGRYGPKGPPNSNNIPPPAPTLRNSPIPKPYIHTNKMSPQRGNAPVFQRLVRESLSQLGYTFEDEDQPPDENQPLDEEQETNEETNEELNEELNKELDQEINQELDQETDPEIIRYPRDLRPLSQSANILQRRPGVGTQIAPISIYMGTFYKVWGLERRNFFRSYYDCRNLKFPQHIIETIARKRSVLENQRIPAHLRMASVWLLETMINMHYISQLPSDNVMFVRYEDMALYPLDVTQQIYNFIGLPVVHSDVIEWIVNHTQGSDRDRYGHNRNSAKMVEVWKDRLGIEVLRDIEGICGNLMENFGYKRYNEN